jgi:predicted  nucleic acid-binding Zn-ribbon protein
MKAKTPLAEAAQTFDDELDRYAALAEAFTKSSLATTRQLERANEAIDEIVAAEERLRGAGQKLIEAVAAARQRQEALAQGVIDRLPAIRERNAQLRELLGEMAAIGVETGALNDRAAEISKDGAEAARHDPRARELAVAMDTLQQRAATLADKARAADFEELAHQAHALHQRLLSAWKKLDKAVPAPS